MGGHVPEAKHQLPVNQFPAFWCPGKPAHQCVSASGYAGPMPLSLGPGFSLMAKREVVGPGSD